MRRDVGVAGMFVGVYLVGGGIYMGSPVTVLVAGALLVAGVWLYMVDL